MGSPISNVNGGAKGVRVMNGKAIAEVPDHNTLEGMATRIRACAKRATADMIEIGNELTKAKKLYPGEFVYWVEHDLAISINTADTLMRLSHKAATVSNFHSLPLSVAYLLASPSAPKEVVEKAVEKATTGEKVTVAGTIAAIKAEKAKILAMHSAAEAECATIATTAIAKGEMGDACLMREKEMAAEVEAGWSETENGNADTEDTTDTQEQQHAGRKKPIDLKKVARRVEALELANDAIKATGKIDAYSSHVKTKEICEAVRQAANEWAKLADKLEGKEELDGEEWLPF
jgi:hypothetical protein